MKRELFALPIILFTAQSARADFWGGDLPLLAQIVTNTLQTLNQLQNQTALLNEEMSGVTDRIYRIGTIAEVVQPSQWDQWRNPGEALKRLKLIYETLPKEYRSPKSDEIEADIATAMDLVSRVGPGANTTFLSGKELEQRGADSSPAVAAKLTASGVGTLVAVDSQNLVIQSHITCLLAQMLADANEKEARGVISKGQGFSGVSQNLGPNDGKFSSHVFPAGLN
jgi:hypothetical protein